MSTATIALVRVRDRGLDRGRIEVQRARVDVREDRRRALVDRAVGRRDERVRRRDHLVAAARSRQRTQSRCSPAVPLETAAAYGAPTALGEPLLEAVDPRARARAAPIAARRARAPPRARRARAPRDRSARGGGGHALAATLDDVEPVRPAVAAPVDGVEVVPLDLARDRARRRSRGRRPRAPASPRRRCRS